MKHLFRFPESASHYMQASEKMRGISAAHTALGSGVSFKPRVQGQDVLFWQYPCKTEAAAWALHATMERAPVRGGELHIYLGLPWATWIDVANKRAPGDGVHQQVDRNTEIARIRMLELRDSLLAARLRLRVHTVCQHIYWRQLVKTWCSMGVTDVWLSHCPQDEVVPGLALHPWSLYAVNAQEADRNEGLFPVRPANVRTLLASFMGAHMPHYLSDIRPRLLALASEPGFTVRLTDRWHFESLVYEHQIAGQALQPKPGEVQEMLDYNHLLADSVFALCPSGAGANTLRLWEALATGAIPVLLGVQPRLPEGGSLAAVDWSRVLLRVADADLAQLPALLAGIPVAKRLQMQKAGQAAYQAVQAQRCFAATDGEVTP